MAEVFLKNTKQCVRMYNRCGSLNPLVQLPCLENKQYKMESKSLQHYAVCRGTKVTTQKLEDLDPLPFTIHEQGLTHAEYC